MNDEARRLRLIECGAELAKREDRDGRTLSGWWIDGVYLGSTTRQALEAISG